MIKTSYNAKNIINKFIQSFIIKWVGRIYILFSNEILFYRLVETRETALILDDCHDFKNKNITKIKLKLKIRQHRVKFI